MTLIESLTFSVGSAVARALFRLWARTGTLSQSPGVSLADLAQGTKLSFRERRGAIRSLERVADEVSEKLSPFLEVEFADLPENELLAATTAVAVTVEAAALDDQSLLETDLEPFRLEDLFRSTRPHAATESALSEGGTAVYNFTLREVSTYIAEIVVTLPEFQSRAAKEMLVRESTAISLMKEVLDRLPDSGFGGHGELASLEAQYRREITRKLDRLELFGVRATEINRRYALSVAYIGLTASSQSTPPASRRKRTLAETADRIGHAERESSQVERSIEHVLAKGKRHLIRGEAGSGKTTLLQWLAVSSARQSFDSALSDWNESLIPFLVKMRRFVGEEFPQPSAFPSLLSRTIGERMPESWSTEMMEQGRALVLIDGVDELKEEERPKAAEWLRDIVEFYPEARYVVTSRPAAVSEAWLEDLKFSPAFLEPMEIGAIDAFIDHWHRAAKATADEEDEEKELARLAARLQATVRSSSQIRTLATSPLLCAMLCALNRDWHGQLPEDRLELYRVGLEMLLERRDAVRGIVEDTVALSRARKEVLLQTLALWLLSNGFTDGKTQDVENLLSATVDSMPGVNADAAMVLKDLLVRSGLIREPIDGRIDFIHRTFQEYLAAKQLADERSVGVLVDHAAEDQWQEVVVLAAGLGSEEFSSQLIESLLGRATVQAAERHRLQLTAVACLETAPVMPPELQKRIKTVLKVLIPPRSMGEAKAIASAGDVAVPLLAKENHGNVATVAPSVRALSMVGTLDAMAALENFASDPRVTVARELIRGWESFSADEYAERILSQSSLDRGALTISSAEHLTAVRHLKGLRTLRYYGSPGVSLAKRTWDWQAIQFVERLESLNISWGPMMTELFLPKDPRGLKQLLLVGTDVSRVAVDQMPNLQRLELFHNSKLEHLVGLAELEKLRTLVVTGASGFDFESAGVPKSVEVGFVRGLGSSSLDAFEGCRSLRELSVGEMEQLRDIEPLSGCESLAALDLEDCRNLQSLAGVEKLSSLISVSIERCPLADDELRFLPSGVTSMNLEDVEELSSLDALGHLPNLQALDASHCRDLKDISKVSSFDKLQKLSLIGASVDTLSPLSGLHELRRLDIEGCRRVDSLDPLMALPKLEWVDARGVDGVDTGPLRDNGVRVITGPTLSSRLNRQSPSSPGTSRT